jgi:hypothetical protein
VGIGAALVIGGRTGSAYLGKLLAGCADHHPARAALPNELRLPPPEAARKGEEIQGDKDRQHNTITGRGTRN